jgi:hypothetical protein
LLENTRHRVYPLKAEAQVAKESIIEKTYFSENLPYPLFSKEGKFLPFVKGGGRDLVFSAYTIMD